MSLANNPCVEQTEQKEDQITIKCYSFKTALEEVWRAKEDKYSKSHLRNLKKNI